jgi:LmbE family N-acetylglucosaminyl deacetylase
MSTADSRRPRNVALAFMAHPDDAEILCGGTLIRLRDLGWEVHIASASPGDCGSATLPPDEIARIRRAEGRQAAESIGARYHCLEERDLQIIYDKASNRKAIDLFRQIAPALVFTHPRRDYMLDHEQAHLLARSACFGYAIPNASALPLVAGSKVPHLYYVDPLEGLDPYSGEPTPVTTLVDITGVMERKAKMLSCHASQRDWLRAHHGMDEYLEAMKRHAAIRGKLCSRPYAEAFVQHRGHAFPREDLLRELFPDVVEA